MTAVAADVIVLGAGPAGAAAASRLAGLGFAVVVVDEADRAGGQVYRAPTLLRQPRDADARRGRLLRERLAHSGARLLFGHRVWSVASGFDVHAVGPQGLTVLSAPSLVVASGGLERHIPVPGWTLPGVFGLGAATVLLKADETLPGRRVVVAGSGPLLLLVAAKILAHGGTVAAVIDANTRTVWGQLLGELLARPSLLGIGALWLTRVLAAGVPLLSGYAVRHIHGRDAVEGVAVGPLGPDWTPLAGPERRITADAVCLGFGVCPGTDVTRLLRAEHHFDERVGGWVARTGDLFASSVPGLFVAGDAAGVLGAAAAPQSGELAAIGVAQRLGQLGANAAARLSAPFQHQLLKTGRFGRAMTRLSTPRRGAHALITDETVVCRCERITRGTLDNAIRDGAHTLNGLKAATRCGMGPCGGRICFEAAAMIIQSATGLDRTAIGLPTSRPPLRPVTIEDIARSVGYAALPIRDPAPL